MTFTWTQHRFSGGALALDVANSVILRFDPERRIDRYADPDAIAGFAQAANRFCLEAQAFGMIEAMPAQQHGPFLALREATDDYFRALVRREATPQALAGLLEAIATILRHQDGQSARSRLDAATAYSALGLVSATQTDRLKLCPNCGWLFLDRSRNRSRAWCDMAVCGNRVKASRHYRRQKGDHPA